MGHSPKGRLSSGTPSAGTLLALLLASCASSGTEPHAMTAGGHEAAAKSDEQASKEHSGQYDPSRTVTTDRVLIKPFGTCAYASSCYLNWSSVRNPTKAHLDEGKRHAELAAQHRAASQALREAEARSCRNVPNADRDVSPFYHRGDIVSAGPFAESLGLGGRRIIGAEIVFAALPGMTAEWLQRVVDCHLARNAVLGDEIQSMSYCPLAVRHVTATVRSAGNGFAVNITSEDEASIKQVIDRAQALTGKTKPQTSH